MAVTEQDLALARSLTLQAQAALSNAVRPMVRQQGNIAVHAIMVAAARILVECADNLQVPDELILQMLLDVRANAVRS